MSTTLAGSSSSPRVPPRKPLIRSVALPETSSPVASHNAGIHDPPRFPWFRSNSKLHRSTTPAPPSRTQLRDSLHIHEPASHRMRTTSMSSNSSDKPLKGILKNSSSRSTTPIPPPTVVPRSGKVEPAHSKGNDVRSTGLHASVSSVSKASSSNSSKLDGYYSDVSHVYSKKRLSPEHDAPSDVSKVYSEKSSQYGRATPIKVPMKPEVISLSWPLVEYRQSRSKDRRRVCFDIAFDPRIAKGVRVPELGHLVDMKPNDIRMPASNHCTITEMRIAVLHHDMEYWPINVERKRGIRCLDVYEAIYKTYHMRLTKEELQAIGLTEYNIKEGMRRVDVLRGTRFFKGLVQRGSDWVLHLEEYHS